MPLKISSEFDSGAILVDRLQSPSEIDLRLRPDNGAEIRQWFHFRLQGARGEACCIRIKDAGKSIYPGGWKDYQAVASYDRETWFRVPTTFDGSTLTISHCPTRDSVYFAYFEPYSWERHLRLLGRAEDSPLARVSDLGSSLDGRDMNLVTMGANTASGKTVWIIARQHPGETMAEWFVEGLIERLLDSADPLSRRLLGQAAFHIVPNMNPDGSVRGNLRTNAAGANLNREWMAPSLERSPEVLVVRERIDATGANMFFDVHGDEELAWNFVAGSESLPGFTPAMARQQTHFCERFKQASPDFQTTHGYPSGKFQEEALKLASKYVGHHLGCLSLTLEMPFKDNADLPDPQVGWNGARSKRLGAAMLEAVWAGLAENL